MFRYLEKYVGTYRVLPYLDTTVNDFPKNEKGGIDESFDDLYIPCSRGIIKHTYRPYYLCWYTDKITTGRNVRKEFDEKGIEVYDYEETSSEVLIYFDDKYMKKVATIVKPKTIGKGISPFSKRNLEKDSKASYTIPLDDLRKYSEITEHLSQTEKMQFGRKVIKEFDEIIKKKKGKKYNLDKERKDSGLPSKEFIHSIGMWNDFVKFCKEYKED